MLMLVGIIRKRGGGGSDVSIEARYLKDGGFQVLC
jgi:hypothetical protein